MAVAAAAGALGAAAIVALPHVSIPLAVAAAHHAGTIAIVQGGTQGAIAQGADLVKGTVIAWIKDDQDRQSREDLTPGAADRAALDSVHAIRPDQVAGLAAGYLRAKTMLAEGSFDSTGDQLQPKPEFETILGKYDQRTSACLSFYIRALYICWDAATGAEWATPEFNVLAQEVADSLAAIRQLLQASPSSRVQQMPAALDEFLRDRLRLETWIRQRIPPQ